MIRVGKKFSKPELSKVINGDTVLPEEEKAPEKVRLDVAAKEIYRSYNRSTLQKFIESGYMKVDGEVVLKSNTKILPDAKLELVVPEELKNADLKPEVIYEDENVLVVNKPSGLLSEAKGEYCPERTLADFGYVAHRLDRGTSGVMILAKTEEVQKFLKKQFQNRTVHKTYYAVVEGVPKLSEARIELPINRDKKRPTTFRVEAGGREAETYYKVLKSNGKFSLVELKPVTGRTHQLRVHMKYLGCPIVGDVVYNEGGADLFDRLLLHAGSLEITLPGGVRKVFEAEMPKEFEQVFEDGEALMKAPKFIPKYRGE